MNSDRPVDLAQKIQYLKQKIDNYHWQTRRSDDFMFRLKFEDYIDTAIDLILQIKNLDKKVLQGKDAEQQRLKNNIISDNNALNRQIKIANNQNNSMSIRQKNLQIQNLQIQLQNRQLQNEKTKRILQEQNNKLYKKNEQSNQKMSFYEKQIEKLVQLNRFQDEEIKRCKEQRNEAQKKQLQIRQKYEKQLGYLHKFQQKNPKYLDRSTEGLKITRIFVNISKQKPGQQKKIFILQLPTIIEVNKIVYGILLGVQTNKNQIQYYDKFQIFQKEITQISKKGKDLLIRFPNRKNNNQIILDKYLVKQPEIVIMLYGKGDSIYVHQ